MEVLSSQTSSISITENQELLAELVTDLHFKNRPELQIKYGNAGRHKCKQDCLFHLSYLAAAIDMQSSSIFTGYLNWAKVMLQSRNIPGEDLISNLTYMDLACRQLLTGDDYGVACGYLEKGIECLHSDTSVPASFITAENPLKDYAEKYLSLLLNANRHQAQALIDDLLKDGQLLPSMYEHIFEATQYEVGRQWQTNKITVAHEHYCTAATQLIMSTLYPLIFNTEKKGHKMIGCTVSGGLHELGIRMVSDFFERDGWDTYYMGASMPDVSIISALKEQQADVLAISVSMPFDISKVKSLINQIRGDDALAKLKILVGGHPFNQVAGLWERVGADGWAKNARDAVFLGNHMMFN